LQISLRPCQNSKRQSKSQCKTPKGGLRAAFFMARIYGQESPSLFMGMCGATHGPSIPAKLVADRNRGREVEHHNIRGCDQRQNSGRLNDRRRVIAQKLKTAGQESDQ
jgi:hypothetical protein